MHLECGHSQNFHKGDTVDGLIPCYMCDGAPGVDRKNFSSLSGTPHETPIPLQDLREWDRDAALTRVKSANAESHQPTTGNSEERQTT